MNELEYFAGKQPQPVEKSFWAFREMVKNYIKSAEIDELPEDELVDANTMADILTNSLANVELSLSGLLDIIDGCKTEREASHA